MTPEDLLKKRQQLRGRLDCAASQVDLLEQMLSPGASIDKSEYESARAEFNKLIPKGKEVFGCKSTCPLLCKCSSHLFQRERAEKHDLYMRYFDAKEACESLVLEVEQASLDLPIFKNRAETVQKRKPKKTQQTAYREVQLEIEI